MSNVETYLAYLAGEYTGELPTPRAIRRELYLAKMCGMDVGTLPEPISQSDIYLKNLAENGTGGGADLPALVNAALAGDILAGKEAIDGSGEKLTGTMPDNGTVTQKLTTNVTEYTIPAGKHSGEGRVSITFDSIKWITPSAVQQIVRPAEGKVLKGVNVRAVQTEEKSVTPTNTAQEVTPSEGKFLSKVTVGAVTGGGGSGLVITNASHLFDGGARLDQMDDLMACLHNVTNTQYMFNACAGVTSLDLSGFDTSKVTNMSSMFAYCAELISPDLSCLDTSNVTAMTQMFDGNFAMTGVNMTGWDTSKVAEMWYMFGSCENLTSLDVSGWDTSNVTNMGYIFGGCKSLLKIIGFSCMSGTPGGVIGFPKGSESEKYSLKRLTFRTDLPTGKYAIRNAIDISYCDMERSGFNEMISTITDVSGLGLSAENTTITITGNPCITGTNKAGETVETLTAEDRAACVAKGWTLVE